MTVKNKLKSSSILVLVMMISSLTMFAQSTDALSTYTPYSLFGLGQMDTDGSAYNLSLGGAGIGMRDNRFINYTNPAAVTARDSLSFMFDFSINQKNMYNSDGKRRSAYNVFNVQNVALTMPIWRSSAFILGIQPFSNVGYKFSGKEKNDDIVSNIGDVTYEKYGTGSIYQLFAGAGVTFWKRLSIGAEAIYYFGYIDRHSNILFNSSPACNNLLTGWDYKVHCFSGKFGIQYAQPFKKNNSELIVGGTYRIGNSMRGDIVRYAYSNGVNSKYNDTIVFDRRNDIDLRIADEFGVGISYKQKNKWTVGFDYIQQNWQNSSFAVHSDKINFEPVTARYYKLGFEITPNIYDIRYYMKKVTYRVGTYFEQSYLKINGNQVNAFGVTLGASFPILKYYNAITVVINAGQRGSLKHNNVRERFINFTVGINLHDIWFVKYRYE